MWLVNVDTRKLELFHGSKAPKYAILSHRWEEEEVSFEDIGRPAARRMKGYSKIDGCCKQAAGQGLAYVWIDTCCIDKRSSAELSESINSMYKWYQRAEICYAFLSDVSVNDRGAPRFEDSAWFKRGWTLQELLAPADVHFFDQDWKMIGAKSAYNIRGRVAAATAIPVTAVVEFNRDEYSVAQRMSWASRRETSREEDRAYSLLGIFNINMPMLYGEGDRAFHRLQEEIIKVSDDRSIFLWANSPSSVFGGFADTPAAFEKSWRCPSLTALSSDVQRDINHGGYVLSNIGLSINLRLELISGSTFLAYLGAFKIKAGQGQRVFVIFIERIQDIRYNRISIRDQAWAWFYRPTPFEDFEKAELTQIVLVRRPSESRTFVEGWGFESRISCFALLGAQAKPPRTTDNSATTLECRVTTTISGGRIYGLSDSSQLVVLTIELDRYLRPICLIDIWDEASSIAAAQKFNFKVPGSTTTTQRYFESLEDHIFGACDPSSTISDSVLSQGCFIGIVGERDKPCYSVVGGMIFNFEPTSYGFNLHVEPLQRRPFPSHPPRGRLGFKVWPVEHKVMGRDYSQTLALHLGDIIHAQLSSKSPS